MPLLETLAWASTSYIYTYAAPTTLATAQAAAAAEASMMAAGGWAALYYTSPLFLLFGVGGVAAKIESDAQQKKDSEKYNEEQQIRENCIDNA